MVGESEKGQGIIWMCAQGHEFCYSDGHGCPECLRFARDRIAALEQYLSSTIDYTEAAKAILRDRIVKLEHENERLRRKSGRRKRALREANRALVGARRFSDYLMEKNMRLNSGVRERAARQQEDPTDAD